MFAFILYNTIFLQFSFNSCLDSWYQFLLPMLLIIVVVPLIFCIFCVLFTGFSYISTYLLRISKMMTKQMMNLSFSLLNPMYKNVKTNCNHITWLHNVQSSIRVKVQYSFRVFTFCKMQPIIRTIGDPSLRRAKALQRIFQNSRQTLETLRFILENSDVSHLVNTE